MPVAHTPERLGAKALARHGYADADLSPLHRKELEETNHTVEPFVSACRFNGQRGPVLPHKENGGHCSRPPAANNGSSAGSNARLIPSQPSSDGIPRIPTLNLSLINGRPSIPLSSLGQHDQASPPCGPKTPVANVESIRDIVVEHLNKIQSDLERRLSSVRMDYQIGLSNSVMAGSARKRSARLMSMSSSDDTYSLHSGLSELHMIDQPFGCDKTENKPNETANMYIGRQKTHIIPPKDDRLPLAQQGVNNNWMYDWSWYKHNELKKSAQLDQVNPCYIPMSHIGHGDGGGGREDGPGMSAPGLSPSTPQNRNESFMYNNGDMSSDRSNKEGVGGGPPDSQALHKELPKHMPKYSGITHKGIPDLNRTQHVPPCADRVNINKKEGDVANVNDDDDNKDHVTPERLRIRREGPIRDTGYRDANLADLLMQYGRDEEHMDRPQQCNVPMDGLRHEYKETVPLYDTKRYGVKTNTIPYMFETEHVGDESYKVLSVSASDVEDISREYDAAHPVVPDNVMETEKVVERNVDTMALTHLPTISGNYIKGISSYTMEDLTQLSKVNSKCALLQRREINALGGGLDRTDLVNQHIRPSLKTGVKPWFRNPLGEKIWRNRGFGDEYGFFLPSTRPPNEEEDPLGDTDLLFHIKQQATYRLELEEHERHGVMDPFYEYEQIRQNKTPSNSDWAKYGRPIAKH